MGYLTWIKFCSGLLKDGLGVEHDGVDAGELLEEHQGHGDQERLQVAAFSQESPDADRSNIVLEYKTSILFN